MKKLIAIALLSTPALSAPYIGVNGGFIDDNQVTGLSVGYGETIAIEGRASKGDDTELAGAYVKLQPQGMLRPYLLLGVSSVEVDGDRDSGPSWGAGVAYQVSQHASMYADYMAYTGYFQPDVGGVNVGITFKF